MLKAWLGSLHWMWWGQKAEACQCNCSGRIFANSSVWRKLMSKTNLPLWELAGNYMWRFKMKMKLRFLGLAMFFIAISLDETRWRHYSIYALRWKNPQKGASQLKAHIFICSRCSWFCISNGMCSLCLSQQSFMVSYVHAALGRPTLLCSTCCGRSVLAANVAWCCGWSLGFLMIWPKSFLRLSRKMSLNGRMIPSSPSPISKFVRL